MEREEVERRQRRAAKRAIKQRKADAQEVFALPAARRLLTEFMADMGVDAPGYRVNPHDMVVAAAMRDAAAWWLEAIRESCPERETQMRAEARKAEREAQMDQPDEDEAPDEHDD